MLAYVVLVLILAVPLTIAGVWLWRNWKLYRAEPDVLDEAQALQNARPLSVAVQRRPHD